MSASENSYDDSPKDEKFQDFPDSLKDEDSGDEGDDNVKGSGGKGKKKYSVIPQAVREKFIKRVMSKEVTIKEAAKEFGLKFSTSKAILQTYKKEGRIGKKKNRERKTKILNVVFLCNYTQGNASFNSNAYPSGSINEMKAPKGETNKIKLSDQPLHNYPEHKGMHQAQMQMSLDASKNPQQYIKELGNDLFKDFIEKNFPAAKMQQLGSLNDMSSMNYPSTVASASLNNNPSHLGNLGNSQNIPSHSFNGLASLNPSSLMAQQQAFGMNANLPQITGLSQFNQFNSHHNIHGGQMNQKRNFDMLHDFELKNEQINDISVKKFKSGEDALWDFDLDKSKRDLEDFIYKTHNAIKNNTYVEKTVTFDFSKYRDDLND